MIAQHKLIKRRRDWYRSMMDCGDEGCTECRVCRHYEFEELWNAVGKPPGSTVSYDRDVLLYLKNKTS